MNAPPKLRKQLKAYEAAGFHPVAIEPRCGSHFKVVFAEFSEPQFLTTHVGCPHAIKNNLARFKVLAKNNT